MSSAPLKTSNRHIIFGIVSGLLLSIIARKQNLELTLSIGSWVTIAATAITVAFSVSSNLSGSIENKSITKLTSFFIGCTMGWFIFEKFLNVTH